MLKISYLSEINFLFHKSLSRRKLYRFNLPHVTEQLVTQDMLRMYDVIKCLKQIKTQKMLITCAPISELPSSISTMTRSELMRY